jgi:hypothetical protein
MPRIIVASLMLSFATACVTSPGGSTASDRLRGPAAAHARALAADDVQEMRRTGYDLIQLLAAAFDW